MNRQTAEFLERAKTNPGASEEAIHQLREHIGADLPQEYLEFLRHSNGAEGPIGEHEYLMLWRAEELPKLTEAAKMSDFVPDLLLIGSNGSSTSYAIDASSEDPARMEFVQVDMYELGPAAIDHRAATFDDLLAHLKSR